MPDIAGKTQVTKLSFGAINHRATLWVDGHEVGSQVTSYTSSVFDISAFVKPGTTHRVKLLVEGRKALVGADGRYDVAEGASWSDDVAQGIFRSADLEVFPSVYVSDTVVRTSVAKRQLSYDVYVSNATGSPQDVVLGGRLGSWNGEKWQYPAVPDRTVRVPAGTTKVTVGPLDWRAGPDSYWLPNVPYRAGYRAQLHDLSVTLKPRSGQPDVVLGSESFVRFGFREIAQVGDHYELNGVRVNFRGDSLQGANFDSIDVHGNAATPTTLLPGFLDAVDAATPAGRRRSTTTSGSTTTSSRIHQVPATPVHARRRRRARPDGDRRDRDPRHQQPRELRRRRAPNMIKHAADLVQRDRNHASVLRWSQANEPRVRFQQLPAPGPSSTRRSTPP